MAGLRFSTSNLSSRINTDEESDGMESAVQTQRLTGQKRRYSLKSNPPDDFPVVEINNSNIIDDKPEVWTIDNTDVVNSWLDLLKYNNLIYYFYFFKV